MNNLLCLFKVIVMIMCLRESIYVNGFGERDYFSDREDNNPAYYISPALQKLEHAPEFVKDWPNISITLGQVSGVTLDNAGRVLVFHRGEHTWDEHTFTNGNIYLGIGKPAIQHKTILIFNETGELLDMWGDDFFYMPHGISVDSEGNVWTTDVALHQVFKFNATNRRVPAMVLGEKFVPGTDDHHFCKPSAVAVMSTGDFFIADGYCNHRILKYNPKGQIILQWGTHNSHSPFSLNVPHALALAESSGVVLVADRERGRVASFRHDNGSYVTSYSSWLMGPRIFSVAYSPVHGGRLYVVNGPNGVVPVRGYVLELASGRLVGTFDAPAGLASPHDVAAATDGSAVYVAQLAPHAVYKFVDERLRHEAPPAPPAPPAAPPATPATLEIDVVMAS